MENIFNEAMKITREMQTFWENRTAQMLDEFVKSHTFVNAMTASLESMTNARKVWNTAISRWAELCGGVTKKDVDNLSRQLYDQNIRLEKMIQLLAAIQDEKR